MSVCSKDWFRPIRRGCGDAADFSGFLWAAGRGTRRRIAAMTVLTGAIGVFEALSPTLLGRVRGLARRKCRHRVYGGATPALLDFGGGLNGQRLIVALQSLITAEPGRQFCLRLRWNFHRNMLAQSLLLSGRICRTCRH